jgi:hypothetical protein
MTDTPTKQAAAAVATAADAAVSVGVVVDRDSLRAKIFSAKKVRRKEIDFFDGRIELRQPTLGDIVDAQDNKDRKAAVVETLIKYAYIPGTDTKVFEEGDADVFKGMPFGADFIRVSKALEELTEVNFLDTSNGLDKTDSDT